MNTSDKTLAVFHSYKMSFAAWQEAGILERELLLYRALKPKFKKIVFVSYAPDTAVEQALGRGDFEVIYYKNVQALGSADILRVNQMSGMMAAGAAKKAFPDKKLVVRCGFMWSLFQRHHNIFKKWMVRRMERWAFKIADKIVLTSAADKGYIEKKYGADGAKVSIIPNLIDTELFKPAAERRPNTICTVGRLEEQKNYESLIEAIGQSEYELHIYGQGSMKAPLLQRAEQKQAKVVFHDRIPNAQLAQELGHYSAFVLPSHYEGNPKALLEAMAAGLPIIASDIEHHRDIISDGVTGLLAGRDSASLRKSIDRLMSDSALAKQLGGAGRQWVVEHCSPEKILAQEVALYKNL